MEKAVVLLSGGLDSTTCMSIVYKKGCKIYPISFDYGQKHNKELDSARKVANFYNVQNHKIFKIDNFGGSALTDTQIDVPNYKGKECIPTTYVPARNILFLSYALGYAEVIGAASIFIGISAVDYSGYPDCRPEFVKAFKEVVKTGTKAGVEGRPIYIESPLINLSKAETIKLAVNNNAPLHLTTSCYKGRSRACGVCDSCILRLKGFKEAGFKDPVEYEIDIK
jgi:7-cyano-7-deazaguanine synthase